MFHILPYFQQPSCALHNLSQHMMPGKDKNDKLEFEEKNTEFNFWAKKR